MYKDIEKNKFLPEKRLQMVKRWCMLSCGIQSRSRIRCFVQSFRPTLVGGRKELWWTSATNIMDLEDYQHITQEVLS